MSKLLLCAALLFYVAGADAKVISKGANYKKIEEEFSYECYEYSNQCSGQTNRYSTSWMSCCAIGKSFRDPRTGVCSSCHDSGQQPAYQCYANSQCNGYATSFSTNQESCCSGGQSYRDPYRNGECIQCQRPGQQVNFQCYPGNNPQCYGQPSSFSTRWESCCAVGNAYRDPRNGQCNICRQATYECFGNNYNDCEYGGQTTSFSASWESCCSLGRYYRDPWLRRCITCPWRGQNE